MGSKEPAPRGDECEVCGDRVFLTEGVPVGGAPCYIRVCTPVDAPNGEFMLSCQLFKLDRDELRFGVESAFRAICPGDKELIKPVSSVPYFVSVIEALGSGFERDSGVLSCGVERSGDGRLDIRVHRKL